MDSEYVRVTTYFDKAGEAVKIAMKGNFFGTLVDDPDLLSLCEHLV